MSKLIPFDSLNLYAVLTELQVLVGGRIQDIRQPEPHTIVLVVYAQRVEHRLLVSIDPQHARLHKITSKVPNAPVPPPFCQSLRKHIEGGFVQSLHMVGFDRIVELAVRTRGGVYTLVAELMGKHSNLILVDPNGLIQSALKWVSPRQSSLRPIRSGEKYQLPPTSSLRGSGQRAVGSGESALTHPSPPSPTGREREPTPLSHSVGEGQGVRANNLTHPSPPSPEASGEGGSLAPLSHSVGEGLGVRANNLTPPAPLSASREGGDPMRHSERSEESQTLRFAQGDESRETVKGQGGEVHNPLLITEEDWHILWNRMGEARDWQEHLEGLSRFTAQEIEAIALCEGLEGVIRWFGRLRRAEWQPVIVREPNSHRILGAYPLPLHQLPAVWQHPRSSVNLAWEQAFVDRIQRAEQEHLRNSLLSPLKRALQARQRALKEIEQTLTEGQKADRWQLFGELILAYGHSLQPGESILRAPDYTQPDTPLVEIRIDPNKTLAENAERYFQKARRARENQSLLAQRYATLQQEYHHLQSLIDRAERSEQTDELKRLYAEAQERGWLREVQQVSPARRAEQDPFEGHKIRLYTSPDGYQVLVGENAQANDYLLTRIARPNDWWLHVRTGTGGHVIIRTNNQPQRVPRSTLEFAGRLAMKHSTDRHAHVVEVDYTLRKYVRKPKGAPAGFALYTHEKTLRITQ